MKVLESYDSFNIKIGDIVLIHYWYDDEITKVKVLEKTGRKFLVSFDVKGNFIKNAPDEYIKKEDMIDKVR